MIVILDNTVESERKRERSEPTMLVCIRFIFQKRRNKGMIGRQCHGCDLCYNKSWPTSRLSVIHLTFFISSLMVAENNKDCRPASFFGRNSNIASKSFLNPWSNSLSASSNTTV